MKWSEPAHGLGREHLVLIRHLRSRQWSSVEELRDGSFVSQWASSSKEKSAREFPSDYVGEPAWELLLDVLVRQYTGMSTASEQLLQASQVALSLAQRWLNYLLDQKDSDRAPDIWIADPLFLSLNDLPTSAIETYLRTESES